MNPIQGAKEYSFQYCGSLKRNMRRGKQILFKLLGTLYAFYVLK